MKERFIYILWFWNRERLFRKKLRKLLSVSGRKPVSRAHRELYIKIWSKLHRNPDADYLSLFVNICGKESAYYIPENVYYNQVELVLNNRAFSMAYSDKNFYERFLINYKGLFPLAMIRGINGIIYDHDFMIIQDPDKLFQLLKPEEMFILKPSIDTSGGSGLVLIKTIPGGIQVDDKKMTKSEFIYFLEDKYNGSFLIQEYLRQHNWFAEINKSSLNSVRVFTYRSVSTEQVHSIHAILRFGRIGSLVDNQAAGGLSCGISPEGLLNSFAIDKLGNTYHSIDAINRKSLTKVPYIDEMKNLAKQIAPHYNYHRILGFDFCLDRSNEVRLLEINCKNIETNFLQMNNGPLFGEYTEEIVDYCQKHQKTIVFDFKV